jgi:hypothetical protein
METMNLAGVMPPVGTTDEFAIRSYTHKELADRYQCSGRILKKWLQQHEAELGPRIGHAYNPRQVRIIVERLGEP